MAAELTVYWKDGKPFLRNGEWVIGDCCCGDDSSSSSSPSPSPSPPPFPPDESGSSPSSSLSSSTPPPFPPGESGSQQPSGGGDGSAEECLCPKFTIDFVMKTTKDVVETTHANQPGRISLQSSVGPFSAVSTLETADDYSPQKDPQASVWTDSGVARWCSTNCWPCITDEFGTWNNKLSLTGIEILEIDRATFVFSVTPRVYGYDYQGRHYTFMEPIIVHPNILLDTIFHKWDCLMATVTVDYGTGVVETHDVYRGMVYGEGQPAFYDSYYTSPNWAFTTDPSGATMTITVEIKPNPDF